VGQDQAGSNEDKRGSAPRASHVAVAWLHFHVLVVHYSIPSFRRTCKQEEHHLFGEVGSDSGNVHERTVRVLYSGEVLPYIPTPVLVIGNRIITAFRDVGLPSEGDLRSSREQRWNDPDAEKLEPHCASEQPTAQGQWAVEQEFLDFTQSSPGFARFSLVFPAD
jgi:hypothetical protein